MTALDDTVRDIGYALRTVRRAPLAAFTIVATVALGLGLVAAVFTVLNALVFRVDAVPDVQQMFAVERPQSIGEPVRFTRTTFEALRRDTSIFSDVYAQVGDVDSRVDGRVIYGTFVTSNFFHTLRVSPTMGRALTPGDDEPFAGQRVMVLSHRGWDRLFARDPAVLGRRLVVSGVTFEVVGVMPEGFRGLAVIASDDYWAPLSALGEVSPMHRGREATVGLDIIGRLKPGPSREVAVAQLDAWDARQTGGAPIDPSTGSGPSRATSRDERSGSRLTLVPRRGTVPQPLEAVPVTGPLFFAFGLILLIGCANVANLLLARTVARQREIGIQLSLGATRRRIIRQLMTEGFLLALMAATLGFVISRVALAVIVNALMTSLPPDIGDIRLLVPDADWRVLLFLIAGAVASTIGFALAPALQATRIEPVRTMRGEVMRDGRPGRARNILIGLQVSASALLLICAAVFLRSALSAAAYDSGVRTSDTIAVQIVNEQNRGALVQAVTTAPSVAAVAASWPDLGQRAAFAQTSRIKAKVAYRFVSSEYFQVFDIPVVRGRVFTAAENSANLSVTVVSETTARTLWPNADPIGEVIRLDPEPTTDSTRDGEPALRSQSFTVAGVVRDVAGLRIAPFDKAVVYVPTSPAMLRTALIARVHGDPELARQALLDRLSPIDPDMARQVVTLRTMARLETFFLRLGFWLTVVLGALALALTLSGLFSVLSYLVEQRTREIGVRMALGATARDVTRLILSQSIRPVALGLLIGGGSAAGLAALLLATPAAATIGAIVRVFDPLAYAVSLIVIIAACLVAASIPAMRAARLDPMTTLRQE